MIDNIINKLASFIHLPSSTIKYTISSLIATLFEFIIYYILGSLIFDNNIEYIFIATVVSRIVGTIINFFINKYWCFQVNDKTFMQMIEFTILFLVKLNLSYKMVYVLTSILPVPSIINKMFVDSILFILGYVVQNFIIFRKKK